MSQPRKASKSAGIPIELHHIYRDRKQTLMEGEDSHEPEGREAGLATQIIKFEMSVGPRRVVKHLNAGNEAL